jgi:transposase
LETGVTYNKRKRTGSDGQYRLAKQRNFAHALRMETSVESSDKAPGVSARRRKWTAEERERIVRASLKKGTTVDAVARMYGVHASQIFEWHKQARQAAQQSKPAGLIPVQVAESMPSGEMQQKRSSSVVIETPGGRITLSDCIDTALLRTVLECLAR